MTRFFFSVVLAFLFLVQTTAFSQSHLEFVERSLASNDITQRLPPLDTILKAAEQFSPLLKSTDADMLAANIAEQIQRRVWMNNFAVNVGWSYGQFDALTVNPDAAVGVATTTSSQNRYTIGASFKMPFSTPINQGSQMQLRRIAQEKIRLNKQNQRIEIRKTIITMYQSLIQTHRLLLISNNSLETMKIQAKRVEREYLDGLISVAEYSTVQEMLVNSMVTLETRKMEFVTAYLILEETTGLKLNL
ncbi:MAG: TolC family protein [Phaeodactylibacter sp.]|nr:TolC family protein [Phaeodactylibacter sp.]